MKTPTELKGETFASYASPEQTALVKWADSAYLAASHASQAAMLLSEASGLRYATLSYEAQYVSGMITERRERAIKELLAALKEIGYEGEIK